MKEFFKISENPVRDIRSPLDVRGRRFFFETGVYKETHKAQKCDFLHFCGFCGFSGFCGNAVIYR